MFDKVFALANRLDAIDAVGDALLSQPDRAATKLGDVLGELAKTVAALDDEMVRYLSLHFHSDESIASGRAVLLGMEVGHSAIRINEARPLSQDQEYLRRLSRQVVRSGFQGQFTRTQPVEHPVRRAYHRRRLHRRSHEPGRGMVEDPR